jgi:hypothetical protein
MVFDHGINCHEPPSAMETGKCIIMSCQNVILSSVLVFMYSKFMEVNGCGVPLMP